MFFTYFFHTIPLFINEIRLFVCFILVDNSLTTPTTYTGTKIKETHNYHRVLRVLSSTKIRGRGCWQGFESSTFVLFEHCAYAGCGILDAKIVKTSHRAR